MKKLLVILVVIAISLSMTSCVEWEEYEEESITAENKYELLENLGITLEERDLVKGEVPLRTEETDETMQFSYELPDISSYEPDVEGKGDIDVEIFLPLENNRSSIRELVNYVSKNFNESNLKNSAGKSMSVTIRSLESSLAEDFIKYGAYMPEGYIASNELYAILMQSKGINVKTIFSRLVGNTMGVAIENGKYNELTQKYGEVTIDTIVNANLEGDLSIGYTNPTNNPTGLNFVVSMMAYFDENNPYSYEATTDFSNFQNTVSSVSYSTEQMLKAVENGIINAFVIENQSYSTNATIKGDFVFMPFGIRHDYPLYAFDYITKEDEEVLIEFSEFFNSWSMQSYADSLGFNQNNNYVSSITPEKYPVGMLNEILKFWKDEKASGKQIVAVFVSDISGSMAGDKIEALKASLRNAMQYVNEEAKVGLISYNNYVFQNLPINKFSEEQQEYFAGAVDSLRANGGTATNNALLMAIKLIYEEEQSNPEDIKPIIILLSDGQTASGYRLSRVEELIRAFGYSIYTIGYGNDADVSELESIANINDGVFINSSSADVGYVIKTLFDAEI